MVFALTQNSMRGLETLLHLEAWSSPQIPTSSFLIHKLPQSLRSKLSGFRVYRSACTFANRLIRVRATLAVYEHLLFTRTSITAA